MTLAQTLTTPKATWRRLFIALALEVFAGAALWFGKLPEETWAWFSFGVAVLFIGGATADRIMAAVAGRFGGAGALPAAPTAAATPPEGGA